MRCSAQGALALLLAAAPAAAMERSPLVYGLQLEQLEYRIGDDDGVLAWDGDAIVGRDEWKLRLQSEGEYELEADDFEVLENQLLVQRMVSDFFDAKLGVRFDTPKGPDRVYGVLGLQGLAPQWIELDADLFVSEKGDVSARLDLDYELLITNHLVLTPTAEVDFAFSEDRAIGVASGLNAVELGLRLSYDLLDRAVAPYVGLHYERKLGNTADLARQEGEDTEDVYLVLGLRLLF